MANTAKTSIKAIIFVTVYIFFIFFISLFKGINLYNIKIPYISISHLFIRIDKKLIIKAQNINITSSKNYQKTEFDIHKEFYLFSKILPFFEEINLKNIKYNNKTLINTLNINKNFFFVFSKDLNIIGKFKIKYNVTYLHLFSFQYKKILLKHTSILTYYNPKYIFINIKTSYKNFPIYLALKINNSIINYSLKIKKLNLKYKNYLLELSKYNGSGKINLNNLTYSNKGKCEKIYLKNSNNFIQILNPKISLSNNYLYLNAKNANIRYDKKIINLIKFNVVYEINSKNILIYAKKTNLEYNKINLNSENLTLNFYFKQKNFFLHSLNNLITYKNFKFKNQEITIYKDKELTYLLTKNNFKHKFFILKNNVIEGNNINAYISTIIGKIFDFNTSISPISINIPTKTATNKTISINNVILCNNKLTYKNKKIIFTTHSFATLNKNLKQILNHFKINIPLTQIKGKNKIKIQFMSNFKNFNLIYELNSTKPVFKIKNFNIPISCDNLQIKGDLNKSNINISNLIFPYRFLNAILNAKIYINIPHKYLNAYTDIKKLDIDKYLQIKNYKEKIALNLINEYVFLLNSAIFINLKTKTIFFYDLKRLLKYSIFNEIFQNGEAIIKLLKNKVAIFINASLNYPVILNQKNPKNIKANLLITKNNIQINSKNINVEIKNLNKLMAVVKNKDIDIIGLSKVIKSIDKLINEINETDTNTSFKAVVEGINTNFIYKNHKFLTQKANFIYDKEFKFNAKYDKSSLTGFTKNGFLIIEGKHYNKKVLIPLLHFFNHFYKIDLNFILVRSPENFYNGKIYINSGIVKDLRALNNIIAFINTIPALITLHSPGFSSKGYKIHNGYINFTLYNKILYFKKINIIGTNINFDGKGYVNLKNNQTEIKLNVTIKFKLKKIPIIGKALSYLFFGKDGNLHVKILVSGNIENPKVKEDLEMNFLNPFILLKRSLTLPFNIF